MLRFYFYLLVIITYYIVFKYILCYGSTEVEVNATINILTFKYILCYGSTFFNYLRFVIKSVFKYILCYGSTVIVKS